MGSKLTPWLQNEWVDTTWGELVELKYGKALKDYKGKTSGHPVFGTNGPVGFNETPLCDFPSVIIGRKGAYRGVHYSEVPFYVIDTAYFVVPKFDINLRWAYYELLQQDINGLDSGSAIPSTRREDFYALRVKVPPRFIQDGIANLLDSFNNKITLNRQINQTLEQMAQTLFKSWFVDFNPVIDNALDASNPIPDELQHRAEARKVVRESEGFKPLPDEVRQLFPDAFEESELGWVPKGWVMKAVSDALTINPKVQLSKGQNAHFVDMKALPTSGYSIEEVIHKAFSGGAKFEQNDVLLARITPCLQNGKTGFVDFLGEGEVGFGSTEFIVLRGDKDVHHTYIACLARHEKFRQHAMQSMVGSSGRQRVQNSCFDDYFIAVPTDDVMKKFAQMTKPSFDKFKANTAESIALAELRDTLLPKLISGELRLDDVEAAVEQETVSAEQQNER
ncbi:restriction endonuclease subunit S [Vibrio cholerae]|nr:restriction endonuclease subunit S [Vibrio cholerae]